MKAEKLLNKLTGRQKEILVQAMEGKSDIEECNLKEIQSNVQLQVHDEILTSESGLTAELWEDYGKVHRYLSSLKDSEEVRKENMIMFMQEEYQGIQEIVDGMIAKGNKPMDILEYGYRQEDAFLSVAGQSFGFTSREVNKIAEHMDISFKEINWEELEVAR